MITRLLCLVVAAGLPAIAIACSASTGPDAPPRTNGCIANGCVDDASVGPTPTTAPTQADGAPADPGGPLAGTTKSATLVKGGFTFTEGPVWVGDHLLFSDVVPNDIQSLKNGATTLFRANTNGANGLAIAANGDLIACEGDAKRLTRSAGGGTPTVIADKFNLQPLNSPNDVVTRADGNIYFTDPNYSGDPSTQDQEAVYRIGPGGKVTRVAHTFVRPNGIALSPTGDVLYVVDDGAGKLLAAPVDTVGLVGAFAELATVTGGDGMTVDDAGNLYVASTPGISVFDRAGATLGTVAIPGGVKATNCTFGGADRKTLYITANGGGADPEPASGVYSIKLNVPGLP